MPIDLRPLDGSTQGVYRPGLEVTQFDSGYYGSRDWFEYNMRSYSWRMSLFGSDTTKLAQYQAWLEHVRMGGGAAYVREALEDTAQRVLSPLGDGSRTSWVLPVRSGATVNGVLSTLDGFYDATDYTTHNAANLLTDDQANAVDGTTGATAYGTCTIAQAEYPVASGLTSFRVTHASAQATTGVQTTVATRPAVDTEQEYTFFAAFRGTGGVRVLGQFYDSGGTQTPAATNYTNTGTMTETGWTIVTVQATSPADAAKAHIAASRSTSSDATFHIGCLGIIPGDLETWFLPSEAPMVIEFDTAPSSRARVLAGIEGTMMSRCRLMGGASSGWNLTSPGHARGAGLKAFEELER